MFTCKTTCKCCNFIGYYENQCLFEKGSENKAIVKAHEKQAQWSKEVKLHVKEVEKMLEKKRKKKEKSFLPKNTTDKHGSTPAKDKASKLSSVTDLNLSIITVQNPWKNGKVHLRRETSR